MIVVLEKKRNRTSSQAEKWVETTLSYLSTANPPLHLGIQLGRQLSGYLCCRLQRILRVPAKNYYNRCAY
jgi:hypothetical protein